jgi:hypothetical protein
MIDPTAVPPGAGAEDEWQPGYVTWAASVYAGALAGSAAASWLSPLLAAQTAGWGLPTLQRLLSGEGGSGAALYLSVALMMVLISVLPGLLSLFLIALTQARLALHPLVGGAFFAVSTGWVSQSVGGALFGLVFGLASLGTIALLLGLRRLYDRRQGGARPG